jgi:hypothetical protein
MSYRLNKTNGELIVELADGQIDNTSTDITLVGRNYRGFGELFNENFIKITENFANTAAPDAPLTGQLWYDTNQQRLKIYNGNQFRTAGAPIVSSSRPSLVQGDIWIDNLNRKLYFYDGNSDNEITLVGPSYDEAQGKTGLEVVSVVDISARERVIIKLFIAGVLFAVITDAAFRLFGVNKIEGYPDDPNDTAFPPRQLFEQGFNFVDSNSLYRGTAESARALVDIDGNVKTTADFLAANENEQTTGSLFIKNTNGLTVGVQDTAYATFKVLGTTTAIENQQSETDIALRTKTGNQFKNAIYIQGQAERIGVHNSNPEFGLDVTGDFRTTSDAVIEGDLTVKGNASYFNVQTLQVLDKNIELGLLDDSTEGDNATVDGGGITLRSSDGSKDLFWDQTQNSWTSNVNFNLETSKTYKINGQNVLSFNELGPTVNTANGLTSIGTLTDLAVDDLRFDTNIISAPASNGTTKNIILDASDNVSVSNSKITDVSEPTDSQDVATKNYVDTRVDTTDVALSFDITALNTPSLVNPYEDVLNILESISPASQKLDGTIARIHGVAYNNTQINGIDVAGAMDKAFVTINNIQDPFDLEDNLSAESVVQDVNFDPANAVFTPTPTRLTFTFIVSGSQWTWQSTV